MFNSLDTSVSGMVAQRTRLEVISANVANSASIYDADGNYSPFRRRLALFQEAEAGQGVDVVKIEKDPSPFKKMYEPGHPEADADGYVMYPNIDPTMEQINAMEASRAYEANVMAAEATKSMLQASMRLLA